MTTRGRCQVENSLKLNSRQLHAACDAWLSGGSLGLGLWLSRHKPHFVARDYAELIARVRAELNDDTDYSQAPLAHNQERVKGNA